MKTAWTRLSVDRKHWPALAGGLGSILIAAIIYSQFSILDWLKRDSAIYMYGGQQMLHGTPPYASIMDPKGPLAAIICGFGEAVAKLLGRDDVLVIRVEFGVIAALTVLAVYLLTLELFDSVLAAVVASAIFASFAGYARDALAGPNGHTPAILFSIVAMWLTARKNWMWAGVAAGLAFLDWQPVFPYALVLLACAYVWSTGPDRWKNCLRAAIGGAIPFAAVVLYYAIEGQLRWLIDGLFVFPLTGVARNSMTLGARVRFIFNDVANLYGFSGALLWIGIVLLLAGIAWRLVRAGGERRQVLGGPLVLLVFVSFVAQVLYLVYDYQGYSHAFPMLVYGALGFGMAAAWLLARASKEGKLRAGRSTAIAAVVVVTATAAIAYHEPSVRRPVLRQQQASACAIKAALVPGTPLWVMGNPLPLVFLHRRNPDNYPYLGSGIDRWKIEHTRHGFAGWTAQVARSRASVVVVDTWHSPIRFRMQSWLRHHGYVRGYIGPWQVFVTEKARASMPSRGVVLMHHAAFSAMTSNHKPFTATRCTTTS